MSLDAVKSGFLSYLYEKLGEDIGDLGNNGVISDASIFMYSQEFKEYLRAEYNADASIFSKSISEIMNMEFENGKIVDDSEENAPLSEEDMEMFIEGVDNPEDYVYEDELISNDKNTTETQITQAALTNTAETQITETPPANANTSEGAVDFTPEDSAQNSESSTPENNQTNETYDFSNLEYGEKVNYALEEAYLDEGIISALDENADGSLNDEEKANFKNYLLGENKESINQTLEGVYANEKVIAALDSDNNSVLSDEEKKSFEDYIIYDKAKIEEALKNAFSQEDVIKAFDTDGDGKLSAEEKEAFENLAKGNNEHITLEDIEKILQDVKEGKISVVDGKISIKDDSVNTEEPAEIDTNETEKTESPQRTQSTSGTSSGGGGSYVNSYTPSSSKNVEKQMTLEELESARTEKEGEVSEAQSELSAVYSGDNKAVKDAMDKREDAREAYDKALEEDDEISQELKDKSKENLDAIEDKESEIDGINSNITETDGAISEQNTVISADKSNLQALKDSLSVLGSISTDDKEKQAEITAKKTELNEKISDADKKLETDNDKLEELEDKKEDYEEKLKTAKEELEKLEETKAEIQEEILANCSQETKDAMIAYNEAASNVNTVKEQEASTAKSNLETKQKELNEINAQINEKKAAQTKRENAVTSGMEAAIEWARKYDDMSQSEMQQIFKELGYQFDSGAWCADFVAMALGEAIGNENLPDWYKNIENKAYCPNIANAGKDHKISAEEAQPGDIVLFDWDGDGTADHVGLFVDNGDGSTTIRTIEGNTSGEGGSSCVEEKDRNRGTVLGIYSMH